MNYAEARVYLDEISKYGSVLGLENMKELLCRLGNPQDDLSFIHISGTNGKGSVLAYLSTILSNAGYRTGRYISPTLFSYREWIQVNEEKIEKESLARHVTAIAQAIEEMKAEHAGNPTAFEVETALSFLYFKEKQCDIVVLETGLGGALDATNVIKTTVMEVITPISMDHMEFLGDTLEKIAEQKAGIIKPHTTVVSAWKEAVITLAGSYQIANAALALEAVDALRKLGFALTDTQVYEGLAKAAWKGRFTLLATNPAVILDGAHNPGAAKELQRSLNLYFKGKKLYYIFGVFQDKDYEEVIRLTAPLAEHIITVQTPNNPRALPADRLKEAVSGINPSVEAAGSIQEAVHIARNLAQKDDAIIIFGSLSFLGEAEKALENEENYHG